MTRKDNSPPTRQPQRQAAGPKRMGRPPENDDDLIKLVLDLLESEQAKNDRDALIQVTAKFPKNTRSAIRKRLARKLAAYWAAKLKPPADLEREAWKAEVLRRAFKEEVAWDL